MKETTIYAPSFRMLLGILVLTVFFAVDGAKAAQTEDAETKAVDDEVNWLFAMNATSGFFDGKTLTLHNVPPVLMFADRRYRIWGHMDLIEAQLFQRLLLMKWGSEPIHRPGGYCGGATCCDGIGI